jgi:TolB-like protein
MARLLSVPRPSVPVALLAALVSSLLLALACAPQAMRGGEGTENPDLDAPALSIKLDREDINYLVADYLKALEGSRFWREVVEAQDRPLVAIWPITNETTQHIDDQMATLLSSIETALVNTGDVKVVDRARQEALVREIGMQQGAAFNPASAQRMGRQLGVQYFFTGKISSVDEKLSGFRRIQYSLFLQVIQIETGIIEFQNEVTRSKAVKK